jgi:hypothetical protein
MSLPLVAGQNLLRTCCLLLFQEADILPFVLRPPYILCVHEEEPLEIT